MFMANLLSVIFVNRRICRFYHISSLAHKAPSRVLPMNIVWGEFRVRGCAEFFD